MMLLKRRTISFGSLEMKNILDEQIEREKDEKEENRFINFFCCCK